MQSSISAFEISAYENYQSSSCYDGHFDMCRF